MEREIMRYSADKNDCKSELLYYSKDKDGYGIAIVNTRHTHPCAYISFPGIEKVRDCDNFAIFEPEGFEKLLIDCGVHGGFTFLGKLEPFGLEEMWIGWDYAHLGDYSPFGFSSDDRKYNSEDVAKDALLALMLVKNGCFEIYEDTISEE